MDKLRVLHIIKDDKFFESVYNAFETVEELENSNVLLVEKIDGYQYLYINHTDKVKLVEKKGFVQTLCDGLYDIIFFHSLPVNMYKFIQYIPKEKVIIWWGWGYDIYESFYGMRPLIEINLYKPATLLWLKQKKGLYGKIKQVAKKILYAHYYKTLRQQVLKRIDYFQPVLPLEYQLLKEIDGFNAKEFYHPRNRSYFLNYQDSETFTHGNNILIGHCASYTNNHIDIWNTVNTFFPEETSVIFPINYGKKDYADYLSKSIQSERINIRFIKDFMPKDEYFEILDSCGYAIFGVMRQQAMGNIYYCLGHGLKVFLYRDSIVYHFLKENGYVVYAIEDIDEHSFVTPLSKEEMRLNIKAFIKEYEYVNNIWNSAFADLCKIKKKN